MDVLPISLAPRPLGRSALRAFPIAYGCWRLVGDDVAAAREKIETALALGIDLFDHADVYGLDHGGSAAGEAEALFGRVLAEAPSLRGRMLLATKAGIVPGIPYVSTADHLASSCEASLKRLRADAIDLFQIHRPDLLAHPAEVASALAKLRDAGKIREVGVSNHTSAQLDTLQRHLPFPIATHQPELSCLEIAPLRDGLLDQCVRERITPLAWSPLAGGRLGMDVGEARALPDGNRLARVLLALDRIAGREGATRIAVALAWLLVHPAGIVPIVGTQTPERLRDCVGALRVYLTRQDWYDVLAASQGYPHP